MTTDPVAIYEFKILKDVVVESLSEIRYAGITGSCLVSHRNSDIDIVAVVEQDLNPTLFHPFEKVSILAFDLSWLSYKKHMERPVGLVPSVLFKSLSLSLPLIGIVSSLPLPPIRVCRADWVNVAIKKSRFRGIDRKNYLVALLFEELLRVSPNLDEYELDNVSMARTLGLEGIANELEAIYANREK